MKIYTRSGDAGTTSLVGGTRVPKTSPRLEAYGTVDELNSHLGLLLAIGGIPAATMANLRRLQHKLFNLGSQLATEPESKYQPKGVGQADVDMLEAAIDDIQKRLPKEERFTFILPGGTLAASQANIARTVCRRCERRMAQMQEEGCPVAPEAMKFINRLSDYLFIVGREINLFAAAPETAWDPNA